MKQIVKIKLPKLVFANDYHEFDKQNLPSALNAIIEPGVGKIKIVEVGFSLVKKKYVGVAYVGAKPSNKTIDKLLESEKLL